MVSSAFNLKAIGVRQNCRNTPAGPYGFGAYMELSYQELKNSYYSQEVLTGFGEQSFLPDNRRDAYWGFAEISNGRKSNEKVTFHLHADKVVEITFGGILDDLRDFEIMLHETLNFIKKSKQRPYKAIWKDDVGKMTWTMSQRDERFHVSIKKTLEKKLTT